MDKEKHIVWVKKKRERTPVTSSHLFIQNKHALLLREIVFMARASWSLGVRNYVK